METKEFEIKVNQDLIEFLQRKKVLDVRVPECPDLEDKWQDIARAYMPDGIREFQEYPVSSLGWMMFIGMAMGYYWDKDWETNSNRNNYYENLRDINGYDCLDETVIALLGYKGETADKISGLVAECASRVYSILMHEKIEPGTELALGCYVACLHQLYLAGMAIELNALGYHMTPYSPPSLN